MEENILSERAIDPASVRNVAAIVEETLHRLKQCYQCGHDNADQAFCGACGFPLNLGDFLKRTSFVVVHSGVDRLLASPQRGEVGGGNAWTVSSPAHCHLRDHPPPRLPPLGGGHTLQHRVGGRRSGVETRGEPFPEITLNDYISKKVKD